jgi:hypothetical protein
MVNAKREKLMVNAKREKFMVNAKRETLMVSLSNHRLAFSPFQSVPDFDHHRRQKQAHDPDSHRPPVTIP